jgi:hypothetical protein
MADTIEYNGYRFPPESHVTIKSEMVYDDADRTVEHNRYSIRVEFLVAPESAETTAGKHNWKVHQKLSKAGQVLLIKHDGFGPNLLINYQSEGGLRDVSFGPKPKIISWNPIGHTGAVEAVWECETSIAVCDGDGNVRSTGISALNYAVRYSINNKGYTNRVISGYLQIAMTRRDRQIPDTADAYRDTIQAPKPPNFTRTSEFSLSTDKRRLDFTINDSEIESPNAYPPGVVSIRARHKTHAGMSHLGWLANTISASIELDPKVPRARAWAIFRQMVAKRLSHVPRNEVFVHDLDVEEDIFGTSVDFSVAYRILRGTKEIFSATGLFDSLITTWDNWSDSIKHLESHRGLAQLKHNPADDQIVDLCTNQFLPGAQHNFNDYRPYEAGDWSFCNQPPYPPKSWLLFEAALESIEDHQTVYQVSLGKDDLRRKNFEPSNPKPSNGETDPSAEIQRIVEESSASLRFVWRGRALRLGYPIPKPDLLQLGGVRLTKIGKQNFRQWVDRIDQCVPVYACQWRVRYAAIKRPEEVDPKEGDPVKSPLINAILATLPPVGL